MVEIREITEKDAQRVSELATQLGYASNMEQTLIRIESITSRKENCAFVAVIENKVVGWIHGFYTLRIESDPFAEIGGLIVDSAYRKLNIGKQLVETVNLWAKTHQVKKLKVRCNTKRFESHKFYEQIGFKENKRQVVFEIDS